MTHRVDPGAFIQADSSGIDLAVTGTVRANIPMGWNVDPVPDVVIGGQDSAYLYRVQGAAGLPGRRVLVVDAGSRELRIYSPTGQLLRRFGGDGEGPGEFRSPVLVPWPGSDSLLIFDRGLPRYQVFSPDGAYRRTVPYRHGWPAGRTPPLGAIGLGAMLFDGGRIVGGEASLRTNGLRQRTSEYFVYDPASAERVALDSFVIAMSYQSTTWEEMVPFRSVSSAAVTQDGVLVTSGRAAEIREYDIRGRLRRIIRVNQPRRAVTKRMIAGIDLGRASAADIPIPDSLPVFRSLRVDAGGWLWAELYDWDPARPREWMVFDPAGEARGVVQTPAGLEVQDIGDDFVLGVWRDDLGVEYVRRHVLNRQTEGGGN